MDSRDQGSNVLTGTTKYPQVGEKEIDRSDYKRPATMVLSPEQINTVSGGIVAGLIGAGLAVITAVCLDNATNGSLADEWYNLTH